MGYVRYMRYMEYMGYIDGDFSQEILHQAG